MTRLSSLRTNRVFSVDIAGDLAVACEEQDFDEMAGNLLDNAFQWTRRKVDVHARREERKQRRSQH